MLLRLDPAVRLLRLLVENFVSKLLTLAPAESPVSDQRWSASQQGRLLRRNKKPGVNGRRPVIGEAAEEYDRPRSSISAVLCRTGNRAQRALLSPCTNISHGTH